MTSIRVQWDVLSRQLNVYLIKRHSPLRNLFKNHFLSYTRRVGLVHFLDILKLFGGTTRESAKNARSAKPLTFRAMHCILCEKKLPEGTQYLIMIKIKYSIAYLHWYETFSKKITYACTAIFLPFKGGRCWQTMKARWWYKMKQRIGKNEKMGKVPSNREGKHNGQVATWKMKERQCRGGCYCRTVQRTTSDKNCVRKC